MHQPSLGRLNNGGFNKGAWCASKQETRQYLQFDLAVETRVTAIAVQGYDGDISKYVTDYRVQYSSDGKFWNFYEIGGKIQVLTGSTNAVDVNKRKLTSLIHARYIRINPQHWEQGICLRVELYGCPLSPVVYPTEVPPPKKQVYRGSVKFNQVWKETYSDKTSKDYATMANQIETAIKKTYVDSYAFKEGFESVQVADLKPGSVIAVFVVIFQTQDKNATWPLRQAVQTGKLGSLEVDPKSLSMKEVSGNTGGKSGKSTQTNESTGLSNGGKIALIVVFMLLIVSIVGVGVGYYWKKRRAAKAQFQPKSFDNPIHYSSDTYAVTGGNIVG